mmetsp:Transcript_72526/g.135486  ORF Transcript_72526/g.135486 Transcript_72526/m.135486 type:complete len:240 (+) Transcript_72526:166-885(+)
MAAATIPAASSANVYATLEKKDPPFQTWTLEMPMDTAGLSAPPDTFPIAAPPTMTHMPTAKPSKSESGDLTVATDKTTKVKTVVKMNSAMKACGQEYALGLSGKVSPFIMTEYVIAAHRPANTWTKMYFSASPPEIFAPPRNNTATVTAGLKCPPEQVPSAKIMEVNDAAMEKTAAGEPARTFKPTVRTSIKVPKNSLKRRAKIGGTNSSTLYCVVSSSGRTAKKAPAANAAPKSSNTA